MGIHEILLLFLIQCLCNTHWFYKNLYNYKMYMSSKLLSILLLSPTHVAHVCLIQAHCTYLDNRHLAQSKCTIFINVPSCIHYLIFLALAIHHTLHWQHLHNKYIFKMWHIEVLFNAGWKKGHDDVIST